MSGTDGPKNIQSTFVVMSSDGVATPVAVTETLFQDLDEQFGDFVGMSLVSQFSFDTDWPTWERHPAGDELVCLLSGAAEMILRKGGEESSVVLENPGEFVLVPRGTWHTARVIKPTTMMFVTPGEGTENVPLDSPEVDSR